MFRNRNEMNAAAATFVNSPGRTAKHRDDQHFLLILRDLVTFLTGLRNGV